MTQLKVGPVHFTIKEVEDLKSNSGKDLYGEVDYATFEVRLNSEHTRESRFVTLWHETLHCFESLYGVKLKEKQVTILATAIAQVMQDNPEMNWSNNG